MQCRVEKRCKAFIYGRLCVGAITLVSLNKNILMIKKILLLGLVTIAIGCQNNQDTESVLVDRVWRSYDDAQYYFSSKYKKQFLWVSSNPNGKFKPAYGTPSTQKFDANLEGWLSLGRFKIEGDTLYVQRDSDIDGEKVISKYLKPGKDSVIGIIEHHTMNVYSPNGRKWVSETSE